PVQRIHQNPRVAHVRQRPPRVPKRPILPPESPLPELLAHQPQRPAGLLQPAPHVMNQPVAGPPPLPPHHLQRIRNPLPHDPPDRMPHFFVLLQFECHSPFILPDRHQRSSNPHPAL